MNDTCHKNCLLDATLFFSGYEFLSCYYDAIISPFEPAPSTLTWHYMVNWLLKFVIVKFCFWIHILRTEQENTKKTHSSRDWILRNKNVCRWDCCCDCFFFQAFHLIRFRFIFFALRILRLNWMPSDSVVPFFLEKSMNKLAANCMQ